MADNRPEKPNERKPPPAIDETFVEERRRSDPSFPGKPPTVRLRE